MLDTGFQMRSCSLLLSLRHTWLEYFHVCNVVNTFTVQQLCSKGYFHLQYIFPFSCEESQCLPDAINPPSRLSIILCDLSIQVKAGIISCHSGALLGDCLDRWWQDWMWMEWARWLLDLINSWSMCEGKNTTNTNLYGSYIHMYIKKFPNKISKEHKTNIFHNGYGTITTHLF